MVLPAAGCRGNPQGQRAVVIDLRIFLVAFLAGFHRRPTWRGSNRGRAWRCRARRLPASSVLASISLAVGIEDHDFAAGDRLALVKHFQRDALVASVRHDVQRQGLVAGQGLEARPAEVSRYLAW